MKIFTLKENLKEGLNLVGHIAGKNQNLPILNNVMIDVKDKGIKLITTNLEIGMVHTIRGKVEEEGEFTVGAKMIADYINLLPNKQITITKKDDNIQVECENYKTKIKGQSTDDFPLIPTVDKEKEFVADVDQFKKALSKVVFAVSSGESRLELSGVVFIFGKNNLTMAATDSYRLAEKEVEIETKNPSMEGQKIIIPAKTLQELIRVLAGTKDENIKEKNQEKINFFISENQVMFTFKNTELISKTIEGQYPDYKQIIPNETKTSAVVNRDEFIRAVKTSSLFSKTGVNDVNLDFPKGGGKMVVSSASGDAGENVVDVEAETSGEDNGIVINYNYLLDGLNHINEENVKIEVIDNNTPCIIKPLEEKKYLYIIMPIKQ
ncbi:MAG: DNA polymerase III subunit beta [Patescibacteria group bacterium]